MGDVEDTTQVDVENQTDESGSDDDTTDDDTSSDDNKDDDLDTGATKLEGKEAQSFIDDVLDDYGLESADELKDWLKNYRDLKGKIGDRDFDEIVKNAETLETYQKHWARQERERQKEGETPEETIARLEKENEELQTTRKKESERRKQAKAAERAYESFCDTVDSTIKAEKAIPKEYRPFLSEFLGVENPINEVDIEDRAAVRKLTKEGIKKLQKFEQAIIKRYRDGKTKIPNVTSSSDTQTDTTPDKSKEPKTLKDARRILHESVNAMLRKK